MSEKFIMSDVRGLTQENVLEWTRIDDGQECPNRWYMGQLWFLEFADRVAEIRGGRSEYSDLVNASSLSPELAVVQIERSEHIGLVNDRMVEAMEAGVREALDRYGDPDHRDYDPDFISTVRGLRPDWLENRSAFRNSD